MGDVSRNMPDQDYFKPWSVERNVKICQFHLTISRLNGKVNHGSNLIAHDGIARDHLAQRTGDFGVLSLLIMCVYWICHGYACSDYCRRVSLLDSHMVSL